MDDEIRYRALCANDPRFDGLFFVGIRTTGIYCRSLCPARRARRENCTFYSTAAAAEASGYRPCLRCRPELAPHCSPYEARFARAAAVIAQIQGGALNGSASLPALAQRHGVSVRQLRRIVKEAAGVTPVQLAQTARLLLAKQLLTESELPVTEIAFASGFASLRRFNELFSDAYSMPPSRFREAPGVRGVAGSDSKLQLKLAYRPPFPWGALLQFLTPRLIRGVEAIENDVYRRTLRIGEHAGIIEVQPATNRDELIVTLDRSLAPVLQPLLGRVRDLFDLHGSPSRVDGHLRESPMLAPLVDRRPGLRVPGTVDGFELAWRAILGQQVSVKGASTLAARLATRFGRALDRPEGSLTHETPRPEGIAAAPVEEIASIGLPLKRAQSLRALAQLCEEAPELLRPGTPPDRVREALLSVPGVGPWTAEYIAMRALHDPDAFPASDLGLLRATGAEGPRHCAELSRAWSPWRAYAALYLWSSLADGPVPGSEARQTKLPGPGATRSRSTKTRSGATPTSVSRRRHRVPPKPNAPSPQATPSKTPTN